MQSIEVFQFTRRYGSAFNLQRSGTRVQIQIYCGAYLVYGHADGSKLDQILSLLTAKANPESISHLQCWVSRSSAAAHWHFLQVGLLDQFGATASIL